MANSLDFVIHETSSPEAIVDKSFNVITANTPFYQLSGSNFFYSLYKIIDSKDVLRVQNALNDLPETGTSLVVYMSYNDEHFHATYLNITPLEDPQYYKLIVHKIDDLVDSYSSHSLDIKKYRTLLSMSNQIFFEYTPSTNIINVYLISDTQNTALYHQDFDSWINSLLESHYIVEEDLHIFHQLCSNIKHCSGSFQYKLHCKIISMGNNIDYTSIDGTLLTLPDNSTIVIGFLNIFNELTDYTFNHLIDDIHIDPLTGILNKRKITQCIQEYIGSKPRTRTALIIIDLDNFKQVNDTMGHMFGDKVIKHAAAIIKNAIGPNGICGRIGGDEFLVCIYNYKNETILRNYLRTIRINVQWLFKEELENISLSCSIGSASYPTDGLNYHDLFMLADKALYIAKTKGRNRYVIYTPELHHDFTMLDPGEQNNSLSYASQFKKLSELGSSISSLATSSDSMQNMLKLASSYLETDRISIVLKDHTTKETYYNSGFLPFTPSECLWTEQYASLFNSNQLCILNNIHTLEYKYAQIHNYLDKLEIKSLIQFLILDNNGSSKGIISFDCCKQFRYWTSNQINVIILICRILEAYLNHK